MTEITARDVVERYAAELEGREPDLDRLVTTPSGLDMAGIVEALDDPWFRVPGREPVALQMMCDFMAPEGSIYFDAIYGDFGGQRAIRDWLIPVMGTIDFIEFVPTAPGAVFDDGAGGTSLDEWQMFAVFGDDRLPLSRGVSVRRFRNGWLTWACDVYDTGPFRVPPPDVGPGPQAEGVPEAEPLPDWPRTQWTRDPAHPEVPTSSLDPDEIAAGFADDAVLHDPIAGELRGRESIRRWFADSIGGAGDAVYEPLGPRLSDGTTSVQEWQRMAVRPDGSRVFLTRGTSVRRRRDGLVIEAADYYDTASLDDPDIAAAARAAGATMSVADLAAAHRPTP